MTLRDALLEAIDLLKHHRISDSRLNVEVLLAHVLSRDRTYLYTHDDRVLTTEEYQRFEEGLYQRISGVPLQYLVGRQEFYGRNFTVNPAVLIPRPETEHIIEAVLELRPRPDSSIVDVGTGSGCIGVTLALELPQARIVVADISFEALHVARFNADQLQARVSVVCMDLIDALAGSFDIVVSNPPYVSPGHTTRLQREVRDHEPHIALFAPEDGFAMYRRLIPAAERVLKPGGYLIMEIGMGMEERILEMFGPRWEKLPTKADLQGIPRTIIARVSGADGVMGI